MNVHGFFFPFGFLRGFQPKTCVESNLGAVEALLCVVDRVNAIPGPIARFIGRVKIVFNVNGSDKKKKKKKKKGKKVSFRETSKDIF
jgi:hypothetical protein